MLSVQAHLAEILAGLSPVPPLDVVLGDAAGCILAEDVTVETDVPVHASAAHDGYAVRADDVHPATDASPVTLPVVADLWSATGEPERLVIGQAVRISTGVALPRGADAVVPLDHTDRGTAHVRVRRSVGVGSGVRRAGADARAGQVVLGAGLRLGPRQISLAAALGRSHLRVHPRPRVVIVPVGDELRLPGRRATGVGVFEANAQALAIAVQDAGAVAIPIAPVKDDRAHLREVLADQLVRADLVLTTGGLSEGSNDTLKDVLGPLGTVRFDHVALAPGRGHGFGTIGEDDASVPIVALPGHPVAALVAYEVFVRPALLEIAGHTDLFRPSVIAYADAEWNSPAGRREFVPAHLTGSPDEGYRVVPVADPRAIDQMSLSSLAAANALAVVPEGDTFVRLGSRVHCLVLEG